MKREWLKDRVILTLTDGDKSISQVITYIQLQYSRFDMLSIVENDMYEKFLKMI